MLKITYLRPNFQRYPLSSPLIIVLKRNNKWPIKKSFDLYPKNKNTCNLWKIVRFFKDVKEIENYIFQILMRFETRFMANLFRKAKVTAHITFKRLPEGHCKEKHRFICVMLQIFQSLTNKKKFSKIWLQIM